MTILIDIEDIYAAQKTIKGISSRTPLVHSPYLSNAAHSRVSLKLECYQPTRAFKVRGATNKIRNCPPDKTIVTASSGNHGFAVSYVCSLLGRKAIVCVPTTANPDKVKAITAYGAELVKAGEGFEAAYEEAARISQSGALMVHPFDDPLVIAGQGTTGVEILEDLPNADTVIVPIGGGLISGIAVAVKSLSDSTRVIGVQAENAPSMAVAFRTGKPVTVDPKPTLADGMITKRASERILHLIKKYVDEIVLVSESDTENALLTLLREDHILAEPSGATSVAAILNGQVKAGKENVTVISGGNISIRYLTQLLSRTKSN